MSYVAHEVGGTVKNLEVTGVTLSLPTSRKVFDFQIDYGIEATGNVITGWSSSVGVAKLTEGMSSGDDVLLDSANQLISLPTIKMGKSVGQNYHNWFYTGQQLAPYYDAKIYHVAQIVKAGVNDQWQFFGSPVYVYSYWRGYQPMAHLALDTVNNKITIYYLNGDPENHLDFTPGEGVVLTNFNVYVYCVNYIAKTIDLWVNGIKHTQASGLSMSVSGDAHPTGGGLGLPGNYGGRGNTGNTAAFIGWDYLAEMTDDSYEMISLYLMNKYGLI